MFIVYYRCVLNMGEDSVADYKNVVEGLAKKDLVMNVCNNGVWGSFRHLPLPSSKLQAGCVYGVFCF